MEIVLHSAPIPAPRVAREALERALEDAKLPQPTNIHTSVALTVKHAKSPATARLRLERLARVLMVTDSSITNPEQAWSQNWFGLTQQGAHDLDTAIRNNWQSPPTRNAMRDSIRAVIREARLAGAISTDQKETLLNALRIEDLPRDTEKQARGHLSTSRVKEAFQQLAEDASPTARRDTALVALLVGAGLRRAEVTSLNLEDLDEHFESVVVRGKGRVVRDVPLAPGVRRAIRAWLKTRGTDPGPLLTPMTRTVPRQPVLRRLSSNTVAQVVQRRFGEEVRPHDLRRTFTGDLLDSGADLSTVAKVLGHASTETTAGYDRRGFATRRDAVEKLNVPVVDVPTT